MRRTIMAQHRLGKQRGANGKGHGREGGREGASDGARESGERRESRGSRDSREAEPILNQRPREIQKFGEMIRMPIELDEETRAASAESLNQILADTITLRDLYKKHHWQVTGHTFYQLHLLFDKHAGEQAELVDEIAERIMTLGGVSLAMGPDVGEETNIPRPPRGREEPPVQIGRLLHAHQVILEEARAMAKEADDAGDDGTNDLIVSSVVRTNE